MKERPRNTNTYNLAKTMLALSLAATGCVGVHLARQSANSRERLAPYAFSSTTADNILVRPETILEATVSALPSEEHVIERPKDLTEQVNLSEKEIRHVESVTFDLTLVSDSGTRTIGSGVLAVREDGTVGITTARHVLSADYLHDQRPDSISSITLNKPETGFSLQIQIDPEQITLFPMADSGFIELSSNNNYGRLENFEPIKLKENFKPKTGATFLMSG